MALSLKNLNAESKALHVLILATVSVLCFFPVMLWGPPAPSGDLTHHLQITNAYAIAFQNGTLLPDWVDAENNGYGAVTVRFYPPLIHITIAIFKLLLSRMDLAIFAAFSLWSLAGGLGIYLWARDIIGGSIPPLAAAVLFTISPYHLNQFYNSFMWGEFASLSMLPFAFFFVRRVCVNGGLANIAGLALSFAALILSNIPQAVICFPCLAIYALLSLDRARISRQMISLVGSGLLAASFTSFYWVRLLAEMSWLHISEPNTDRSYDYRHHFLLNSLEFDAQGAWFGSVMLVLLLGSVAGLLILSGRFRSIIRERSMIGPLAVLAFSVVMMLPVSRFLWDVTYVLQSVQFPWRFLSPASLAAAVLMAYGIAAVTRQSLQANRPVVLVMAGVLLIFATFSIKQVILGADLSTPGHFNRVSDELSRAKGLYHWWPVWADKSTFDERRQVVAGQREFEITQWDPEARQIGISAGSPTTVRTAILYYPWWRVTVNGKQVEMRDLGGALAFDIGPERSDCSLAFREPAYTGVSRAVSMISIFSILMFLIAASFRREFFYE